MAENIMLNSVGAIEQPCLTPLVTGNGQSTVHHVMAMNLGVQPKLALIFQSQSRLTVSKVLVRSTKVM